MKTGLAGKVVLITGSTRNHGRAGALAFAEEGAHLLLCTRQSMGLLEETAHMASPFGVKVVTGQCDVTDEEQVKAFVDKGLSEFGRIDVVVNNAGWRARGELLRISTENWLATMGVNLHAVFLMSQAALPSMVQHRWGRIINYSGIAAFRGSTGTTAKMAGEGLTRAIAREYGKYNITANLIGPGVSKSSAPPDRKFRVVKVQALRPSPFPGKAPSMSAPRRWSFSPASRPATLRVRPFWSMAARISCEDCECRPTSERSDSGGDCGDPSER